MTGWSEDWPSLCSQGICAGQLEGWGTVRSCNQVRLLRGWMGPWIPESLKGRDQIVRRRPGNLGQIWISERTGFTWSILFQRQTQFMMPPEVPGLLNHLVPEIVLFGN